MYGAWFAIFGALITISFNFILIPKYGYMGAAWTTLICYGSMMVLSYATGQRNYKIPYELGKMAGYLLLAIALFLFSKFIIQLTDPGMVLKLFINTLILFSYLFVLSKIERPPVSLTT